MKHEDDIEGFSYMVTKLGWSNKRNMVGMNDYGTEYQEGLEYSIGYALKSNQIGHLLTAHLGKNTCLGKFPSLPLLTVEERNWFDALSLAPPPCSHTKVGIAINKVSRTEKGRTNAAGGNRCVGEKVCVYVFSRDNGPAS
ncbi:hypothetical protein ACH5RR_039598 [Cinchona calisaya]|uniref:Uncharacterized protein n=1 Tax=Cinchona calisaya TaxID=153742 RepID=A0ABD2Y2S2_9GENT